jgi:hypothetical protein
MMEAEIVAVFATEKGAKSFIDREFSADHEKNMYSIDEHEVYIM